MKIDVPGVIKKYRITERGQPFVLFAEEGTGRIRSRLIPISGLPADATAREIFCFVQGAALGMARERKRRLEDRDRLIVELIVRAFVDPQAIRRALGFAPATFRRLVLRQGITSAELKTFQERNRRGLAVQMARSR